MTNRMHFDFTGTSVLVTGGTSGIGHALRYRLRRRRGLGHGDGHSGLSRRLRDRPRAVRLPPV